MLLVLLLQDGEARVASIFQYFGVFSTCKRASREWAQTISARAELLGHSPVVFAVLGSWAWTGVMGTERN